MPAFSFLYHEDGYKRFLQNIGAYLSYYTAAFPRRASDPLSVIDSKLISFFDWHAR
jgi:hypothetical protein